MKRIAVIGASGRTGSHAANAVIATPGTELSAAIVSPGSPRIGQRVCELLPTCFTGDLESIAGSDAVIEFSTPGAAVRAAQACARLGVPILVASTGHSPEQRDAIESAGQHVAVGIAPNTSLGAIILGALVGQARELAGGAFDVEVMEIHHRMKRDAPSGTARALVESAAQGGESTVFGRAGLRGEGEVGVVSLRGGDTPGDHTVYMLGLGERIELTHRVHDRRVFGQGSVSLALRLCGRKAGVYSARSLLLG